MSFLLLPLDERPCNYDYPQRSFDVVLPPKNSLGWMKKSADLNALDHWLWETLPEVDGAVISLEMLVYGGLLPSRIHHSPLSELQKRLALLSEIKKRFPKIKLYVFALIMRCPTYDSAEEEPEYYAHYGRSLFRTAYLKDKEVRLGLTNEEREEMAGLQHIPSEIIKDFEERRANNLHIVHEAMQLLAQGIIDFMEIPQDDCSPFGYTARDQQKTYTLRRELELSHCLSIHPGADEAGLTLLARLALSKMQRQLRVYPFYSSTSGPFVIPAFEDRPLHESVKSHCLAAGLQLTQSPDDADFILALHSAGEKVFDAPSQYRSKDLSYYRTNNSPVFVASIAEFIQRGKPVALADVAMSNGGDLELLNLLHAYQLEDKLLTIAAWNTSSNTLGTTIADAIATLLRGEKYAATKLTQQQLTQKQLIQLRILEDYGYQSITRTHLRKEFADLLPRSTAFTDQNSAMFKRTKELLSDFILKNHLELSLDELEISFPWQRFFEIGLQFKK